VYQERAIPGSPMCEDTGKRLMPCICECGAGCIRIQVNEKICQRVDEFLISVFDEAVGCDIDAPGFTAYLYCSDYNAIEQVCVSLCTQLTYVQGRNTRVLNLPAIQQCPECVHQLLIQLAGEMPSDLVLQHVTFLSRCGSTMFRWHTDSCVESRVQDRPGGCVLMTSVTKVSPGKSAMQV
jgi:hypothetical protein